MLLIGLDVGMQKDNTGVAVYDPATKKIIDIFSCNLYRALRYLEVKMLAYPGGIGVVLEDAGKDNTNYRTGATMGITARMGRDVGKNQAGATIVKQLCAYFRAPCLCIAPSQRRKASKRLKRLNGLPYPTKTTKAQFEGLTGCREKTNEHNRDAGTLVWGMSVKDFKGMVKMQEVCKR